MFMGSSYKKLAAFVMACLMLFGLLSGASAAQSGSNNESMTISCGSAIIGSSCSLSAEVPGNVSVGRVVFYANGVPFAEASVEKGVASVQWTPSSASTAISASYYDAGDNISFSASCIVVAQSMKPINQPPVGDNPSDWNAGSEEFFEDLSGQFSPFDMNDLSQQQPPPFIPQDQQQPPPSIPQDQQQPPPSVPQDQQQPPPSVPQDQLQIQNEPLIVDELIKSLEQQWQQSQQIPGDSGTNMPNINENGPDSGFTNEPSSEENLGTVNNNQPPIEENSEIINNNEPSSEENLETTVNSQPPIVEIPENSTSNEPSSEQNSEIINNSEPSSEANLEDADNSQSYNTNSQNNIGNSQPRDAGTPNNTNNQPIDPIDSKDLGDAQNKGDSKTNQAEPPLVNTPPSDAIENSETNLTQESTEPSSDAGTDANKAPDDPKEDVSEGDVVRLGDANEEQNSGIISELAESAIIMAETANVLALASAPGNTPTSINLVAPQTVNLSTTYGVPLVAYVNRALGRAVPTGTMQFFVNGQYFATATLTQGSASTVYLPPSTGTYVFTATYLGDSVYQQEMSSNVSVSVINDSTSGSTGTSASYRASIQVLNGTHGNDTMTVATITGSPLTANDRVTLRIDDVYMVDAKIDPTTGRVVFYTAPVASGVHTYSIEYRAANSLVVNARASVTLYCSDGRYSIIGDWGNTPWGNYPFWGNQDYWNSWDYWNSQKKAIGIYANADVSSNRVTLTATLYPTNQSGYYNYTRYDSTVDWYGNQYGRYNNWYPRYDSYTPWVAPDGSSYGRVNTPTSWNTYWGASPSGTVSFYLGNTLIGSAPVYEGSAQFTWTNAPAGTHTISVTYSGDYNYNSASTTITAQVKSSQSSSTATKKPSSATARATAKPVSTPVPQVTQRPAASSNVYLRNGQGVLQQTYDLKTIVPSGGDIMLETTKALDVYKYGISLTEMRKLASAAQGRLVLSTPQFACAMPYSFANNMTDLTGYLVRYNLNESQVEVRVDIESIQNAALVSAYQRVNPGSTGQPTFYRIDAGLNNANGIKLDYNPGKFGLPLYLVFSSLDFTKAERYDEQTGLFYPATVDLSSELPILTVEQSGIYVLTK